MHMKAGMLGEPRLGRRVFEGGVIVGDQVQIECLGGHSIDGPQEFEPLLVAVRLHALPDHSAGGDIKGCKQRRRAVALVIIRPFFIGRPGCVRSSAWIWVFSSTESTSARSGGLR